MIAIVTGAASGLGRATAARLLRSGGSVVIADLPSSAGEQVARELGDRAAFAPVDVTSEHDVAAALDVAEARFGGRVDCAVNCAGVGAAMRTLTKNGPHPLDEFARVLTVNTIGTFNVIRLAADRMAQREADASGQRGVIVNTASAAGITGAGLPKSES